jgi:hypothetical protein
LLARSDTPSSLARPACLNGWFARRKGELT